MRFLQMLPEIDFQKIRPLKDTRHKGFEELCVQLFRSSFSSTTRFYRVDDGGGDGGVEDIAIRENGNKIGLQAKFFEKLRPAQWSQIDKSVRTALQSHSPDLLEYRIACPCDRSKNFTTWNNYCEKWQGFAKELGYTSDVGFVWWGSAELRDFLIKEENKDKVYYWFGCRRLSMEWLLDSFHSTKKLLDIRYTPTHHVRTESEKLLDAFFLTEGFESFFWKLIRKILSSALEGVDAIKGDAIGHEANKLGEEITKFRSTLSENYGVPSISISQDCFRQLRDRTLDVYRKYEFLREGKEDKPRGSENVYTVRPYSYQLEKIGKILSSIDKADAFIARFKCYDSQKVLVLGNAGAGKSHLLASSVENAIIRNQPAILVLGEQFLTNELPLEQLCHILGWEQGIESLLGALNAVASVRGKPAIIAIDALNESGERKLWKSHLPQTVAQITKYRNLRIMVSCRSDFAPFVLPSLLSEGKDHEWSSIEHQGFGDDVFKAVAAYFKGYKVTCDHFPPVLEEFQNPLFLKTFCEAYCNSHVPPGPLSLDKILKKRVKKCQEFIREAIDCPEYKVKNAIDLLASKIAENRGQPVPYAEFRSEIDGLFDGGGDSRSLYTHLRSNGMLAETLFFFADRQREPELAIRFPYERFSDYFIASKLLDNYCSIDALKTGWRNIGLPDKWVKNWRAVHDNRGLLRMLAILIPERFGCEFIDFFLAKALPRPLFMDFLASLPWRTAATITQRTDYLLEICASRLEYREYFEELLKLITIPNHPLNALQLHARLSQARLWERESNWTVVVSEMVNWSDRSVVDDILRWSFHAPPNLISDEQAWLVALFLAWILSSNDRFLRLRASLALTRILIGRTQLAGALIKEFHNCNDPYVVERVYAAACGVALRTKDKKSLCELALVVFQHMFTSEYVPPNILQRDFAQLIMEYANSCGVLPEGVDVARFRAKYRSKWPRIIAESKAKEIEEQEGWSWIKHSLQPEESGYYGDFGRYVMGSEVHHFSRRTLTQRPPANTDYEKFSGIIARRYILQRIKQFGWTSKRFGDYENNLSRSEMRVDEERNKVERISKKYQWIALHELLGYLSDHYRVSKNWEDTQPVFQGAWQTYARDFDPTQPLLDPREQFDLATEMDLPPEEVMQWWNTYPEPFADLELRLDRERWVMATPPGFEPLIEQPNVPGQNGEWLTLSCHYSWAETPTMTQDERKDGQLKMWTDLRCWLVLKKDRKRFLDMLKEHRFWGKGVDYPEIYGLWLGEFPWAPSMKKIVEASRSKDRWIERLNFNGDMYQTVCGYSNERSNISARLPGPVICQLLNLRWTGNNFEYVNPEGELLAFCHGGRTGKPGFGSPLLVKKEPFLAAIDQAGLVAIWAILSERSCYSYKMQKPIVQRWKITQRLYGLENGRAECLHDKEYEIPL